MCLNGEGRIMGSRLAVSESSILQHLSSFWLPQHYDSVLINLKSFFIEGIIVFKLSFQSCELILFSTNKLSKNLF